MLRPRTPNASRRSMTARTAHPSAQVEHGRRSRTGKAHRLANRHTSLRTLTRRYARGPSNPHVNPTICAWAAPPRCISSGLRAHQGVNAHIQGFAYAQSTMPDIVAPKTQTTLPLVAHFQRFSPRWSAVWAPHDLEPRPRRHQTGDLHHKSHDTPSACSKWRKPPPPPVSSALQGREGQDGAPVGGGGPGRSIHKQQQHPAQANFARNF